MIKRIVTVVGARPQFIKAAALSRMLKDSSAFEEVLVHTGQHFDQNMSEIFFKELALPNPKYTLNIHGGPHGQMTGRMLEAIENTIVQEKPDGVLVYGDTNSTLAGALAASKLLIPTIHVEAGLRSYNKKMPEEINRIMADQVSTLLFCPTKVSVENLKKEGIEKGVHLVGDIMYDATLYALNHIKEDDELHKKFNYLPSQFALMTIHRAESTQSLKDLQEILNFAKKFANENQLKVVFPVHPRTQKLIVTLPDKLMEPFIPVDPLSYFETHFLLTKAKNVLTDSGGLQKEAYFHRVPCITLRNETEWVETIEHGWNRLWTQPTYQNTPSTIDDYGDGQSAPKILKVLSDVL
ncbi:MAG: UDP-N-acetylglucosamine 2-epimerase (non-hydrolyzing) [Alphaproteobacteria bacterium]|nr:UDP-N-acetylglucosamine 2-epimerase (non-hydrolyzing) [Alphaproteobacteria bacterium]